MIDYAARLHRVYSPSMTTAEFAYALVDISDELFKAQPELLFKPEREQEKAIEEAYIRSGYARKSDR